MFFQIFRFLQLWYSLGLGGHLFKPNSPFSSKFVLGCCEIDPETEEKQPVQILCSPGQTENSSSMNHNNSSKTTPYWIFKVSNLLSCCIYAEHNWVLEHWTFPKTYVAEKNTPNFVLNLVRPSLHTHSSDLKHATKPNIVTGEKMHTQKRIFFFGPFVVVFFCSPFPPPRRTAITKSTATFTISALSSWVSSTSAHARAHTHGQKKRPWKQNSPKASNNNTQLHSSTTTTVVSQSVSQISKSQNARPPECQIPRWWNRRNALQNNQPYKKCHRNDDERGEKKPADLIDLSAALTHSLTHSSLGVAKDRRRRFSTKPQKKNEGSWSFEDFEGTWEEAEVIIIRCY